ncbi:hypothetical protein WICMUC_003443 [Wickerhamomyces mucosus]|uniref:Uncharacterized protein n=1 Tax=Wickerhamomyces mucosus TaxID=1378264 RepID=A0A9P8PLF5_9ASCO|nr:hypothetical protein WICMUC_003443 [Wickerhamomyces mucosus]
MMKLMSSPNLKTKMSHVKEIKEKQHLQNLFQSAHSSTSSKISSWLKPKKVSSEDLEPSSHNDFLQLPIISGASGLSLSLEENVKIGEYIQNGNKKKPTSNSNKVSKRNESRSLEALRNKLKKNSNKIHKQNQNIHKMNQIQKNLINSRNRANDNDSDSEEEVKVTKKKKFGLLIDSKVKKR